MRIRHIDNSDDEDRAAYGRHEFYIHGPSDDEILAIQRFARRHKARCFAWKVGRKKYADIHICRINQDDIAVLFKLSFV